MPGWRSPFSWNKARLLLSEQSWYIGSEGSFLSTLIRFHGDAAMPNFINLRPEKGTFDLAETMGEAKPHGVTGGPSDTAVGNFGTAFLASPVQFDATYTRLQPLHPHLQLHNSGHYSSAVSSVGGIETGTNMRLIANLVEHHSDGSRGTWCLAASPGRREAMGRAQPAKPCVICSCRYCPFTPGAERMHRGCVAPAIVSQR